jgi:hypothetical protein
MIPQVIIQQHEYDHKCVCACVWIFREGWVIAPYAMSFIQATTNVLYAGDNNN